MPPRLCPSPKLIASNHLSRWKIHQNILQTRQSKSHWLESSSSNKPEAPLICTLLFCQRLFLFSLSPSPLFGACYRPLSEAPISLLPLFCKTAPSQSHCPAPFFLLLFLSPRIPAQMRL